MGQKYLHYNNPTDMIILGYYDDEIHDTIPTPNIAMLDTDWKLNLDITANVVDDPVTGRGHRESQAKSLSEVLADDLSEEHVTIDSMTLANYKFAQGDKTAIDYIDKTIQRTVDAHYDEIVNELSKVGGIGKPTIQDAINYVYSVLTGVDMKFFGALDPIDPSI